jgi:hypothetical protein
MNPTVELVLKHKKANMRKSDFLMLEANSYNALIFFTFFFFIADSSFFLFAFFLGPYSERNFF